MSYIYTMISIIIQHTDNGETIAIVEVKSKRLISTTSLQSGKEKKEQENP